MTICRWCLCLLLGPCLAVLAPPVRADSTCWPERDLLGRTADAYVWGGHAPAGTDPNAIEALWRAPLYDRQGRPQRTVTCDALRFVRFGFDCRADTALLPLLRSRDVPGLARAHLQSGERVWVKPQDWSPHPDLVREIVQPGDEGLLIARDHRAVNFRQAPDLSAPSVRVGPGERRAALAFVQGLPDHGSDPRVLTWVKVQRLLRNAQGTWMALDEYPGATWDGGLTHEAGPVQRRGYVLHRDHREVVQVVVSAAGCD